MSITSEQLKRLARGELKGHEKAVVIKERARRKARSKSRKK